MALFDNLSLYQGDDFSQEILYLEQDSTPVNLTNYSARMQVRQDYGITPIISVTTETDGGITKDNANGIFIITITNELTSTLIAGSYIYDFEVTDGDDKVTTILKGNFLINKEVTK